MTTKPQIICGDLLIGAPAIAKELKITRGRVYGLCQNKKIPHFKLGNVYCARRSTLTEFFSKMEKESVSS